MREPNKCVSTYTEHMNLFTYKRCEICQAEVFHAHPFCQACFDQLRELQVAERQERSDYVIFSLFSYVGDIQELIHRMKFQDQRFLSAVFAAMIVTFLKTNNLPVDAVSYVPMHDWKRWVRGYDQAKDLAEELGKQLQVPCVRVLKRTRMTKSLYRLGRLERRRILEGSMAVVGPKPPGYLMIIDDILTTGATIDACAKALSLSGLEDYFFLVVAKAIQNG